MTPTAVETLARQMYNATGDTSFFTQAEIMSYLTDASNQLSMEANVLHATDSSTTTTAGTRNYSIPSDCMVIKRVEYDGQKLEPISFRIDDALTLSDSSTSDQGTPQYYVLWNDEVLLRPTPDTSAKTIKFYYFGTPSAVTASGTFDIPAEYHYMLADYVVYRMALKDEEPQTSDRYLERWEKHIKMARRTQRRKFTADRFKATHDAEQLPTTVIDMI